MPAQTTEPPPDALVIGASGVIGSAIARRLSRGCNVLATYCSRREQALALLDCGCQIERLDVRDEASVEALLARVRPTRLVLCAGVSGAGLVARLSDEAWRHALGVHLDGLFWALRSALKYLPDGSRVVWLGSRVAQVGGAGQSAYASAKAAGEALAKSAAREGAERGISVNVVCPGFVLSSLTGGLSQERLALERSRDVSGGLGQAELCAEMVAWLLSDAARGLSGQVLHADGRVQ